MLEPLHIDVVISFDIRQSMLKIITQKFNLVILRFPSLWKQDGVLLSAQCVFVDIHSGDFSGLYFIESQPLESCFLYILFPFDFDRDLIVKCGKQFAGTILTRTGESNAWGFSTFQIVNKCTLLCSEPNLNTAVSMCNQGQQHQDCSHLSQSTSNPPSTPASSTPVQPGTPACSSNSISHGQSSKDSILQCIKETCEQIESFSLEGLGSLDDYADLIICAREAHEAQNAACTAWISEMSEMTECAISIDGAIDKLKTELQLPARKDYTPVLDGMKNIAESILSIKLKLNKFNEIPHHFETLQEFKSISCHYDRLQQNYKELQQLFTKLACGEKNTRNQRVTVAPYTPRRSSPFRRPRRCNVKSIYAPVTSQRRSPHIDQACNTYVPCCVSANKHSYSPTHYSLRTFRFRNPCENKYRRTLSTFQPSRRNVYGMR